MLSGGAGIPLLIKSLAAMLHLFEAPTGRRHTSSLLAVALILAVWCVGVLIALTVTGEPFALGWFLIGFAFAPWVALSDKLPNKKSFYG